MQKLFQKNVGKNNKKYLKMPPKMKPKSSQYQPEMKPKSSQYHPNIIQLTYKYQKWLLTRRNTLHLFIEGVTGDGEENRMV